MLHLLLIINLHHFQKGNQLKKILKIKRENVSVECLFMMKNRERAPTQERHLQDYHSRKHLLRITVNVFLYYFLFLLLCTVYVCFNRGYIQSNKYIYCTK